MPLELQIIRAHEFLRLGPQGRWNFAKSREALCLLARACRKRGLDRALLDLRALVIPGKPLLTHSELAALVETFREAGFGRQQRLAVLYRRDPHGGVHLFAFLSRLRGWCVRAFGDFEEALAWLAGGPPRSPEPSGETVTVRIVKRDLKARKKTGRRTVHGTN